jgi:hypothetical protein
LLNHVLRKETKWKKNIHKKCINIQSFQHHIFSETWASVSHHDYRSWQRDAIGPSVLRYNWIDRHHGLINRYKISASQRTKNMFHLSWPQSSSSFFVYDLSLSGATEFTHGFYWGSCYSIFSFICMFCRSFFVLLYFFFWPLCCLFFFDIRFWLPLWYLQTLLRMSTMTGAINGTGTAYPSENLKLNLSFKSSSHCSIFCLSLDALWRYGRCVVIQYILMVTQYFITCSPNFDTKYVVEIQNSNFNRPLPVSLQLVPLS